MQFAAFPDHKAITLNVIADDQYVVHHMRSEGTHSGQFLFMPPSGKYLTWEFIDIFRVRDNKFVEHWVESDTFAMMQQAGMIPGQ
jgi:predicted ester cyclase